MDVGVDQTGSWNESVLHLWPRLLLGEVRGRYVRFLGISLCWWLWSSRTQNKHMWSRETSWLGCLGKWAHPGVTEDRQSQPPVFPGDPSDLECPQPQQVPKQNSVLIGFLKTKKGLDPMHARVHRALVRQLMADWNLYIILIIYTSVSISSV